MKRASNVKRLTLIERDELDRLRAKQIRDYSPVLTELVAINREIERVLLGGKLAPDDRVKVLALLHSRFDNIYRQLKYNGIAPVADGAQPIAPLPAAAAAAPVLPAPLPPAVAVEPVAEEELLEEPVPDPVAQLKNQPRKESGRPENRSEPSQLKVRLQLPGRAERNSAFLDRWRRSIRGLLRCCLNTRT